MTININDSDFKRKRVVIDDQNLNENNIKNLNFSDSGTMNVIESTELGDTLKHLNDDTLEQDSNMSGIDMKTRLHYSELSGILGIDTLVSFRYLPRRCLAFTRQKKRLAVSLGGQGRKEIVDIAGGRREIDAKKGFLGGMFNKNNEAQK